ncbi:YlaC family protein [Shigella flexneri]
MNSSFPMLTHATVIEDIDVLDFLPFRYNGEWYNTRFVPAVLVEAILCSRVSADVHR